ncbi:unnamed protein product [Durusdinium trenchii]|uniref:Uncharacterized protein n=1 Tax=Durusdinium trenchii TaxID=1381693 RepID=A0ABP0ML79_9DINO
MAEARRRRAVLGAQGLAALWITSSEILGEGRSEPPGAKTQRRACVFGGWPWRCSCWLRGLSSVKERSVSRGGWGEKEVEAGGARENQIGVGRALGALPAAALAMAVLLPWGRLVERAGWRTLLSCQLLLRPLWEPEACPLPSAPLASTLALATLLALAAPRSPVRSATSGLLSALERSRRLGCFAFFVWLTLVLPIAYSAYTAESADTARVATWAWPVAQLGDLLLGACAAGQPFAGWQGGVADVWCTLLAVVLWLPNLESLEGFHVARGAALGLTWALMAGLGQSAWQAIFLCRPSLELCRSLFGDTFHKSAPGFLAFNFCLWVLSSNLATFTRSAAQRLSGGEIAAAEPTRGK